MKIQILSRIANRFSMLIILAFFISLSLSASAFAADKYWIGPAGGNFKSDANWSTTTGGANDTTQPGVSDAAHFTSGDVDNVLLNGSIAVGSIYLHTGYTGTLTSESGVPVTTGTTLVQEDGIIALTNAIITVGSTMTLSGGSFNLGTGSLAVISTFTQSGGTMAASTGTMDYNGAFTVSDGIFYATSGTTTMAGNMTINGTGVFEHNSGIVEFDYTGTSTIMVDVLGTETFSSVTINLAGAGGKIRTGTSDIMTVVGTLKLQDGETDAYNAGGWIVQGDLKHLSTFSGGDDEIELAFTTPKTITLETSAVPGEGGVPPLTIADGNATLNVTGTGDLTIGGAFVQNAGTFNAGTAAKITHNGTVNLNGGLYDGQNATEILIEGAFTIAGGTFDVVDVDIVDIGASTFSTFTMTSGSLNAPTGDIYFNYNFNISTGGTYTDNGGSMTFDGTISTIMNLNNSLTITNLTINKTGNTSNDTFRFETGDILTVTGILTFTKGEFIAYNSSKIISSATGSIQNWDAGFLAGTGVLQIDNAADFQLPAGVRLPTLIMNNTDLDITTAGGVTAIGAFTLTAGTFENTANGNLTFNYDFTQTGGTFYAGSATQVTHSGSTTLNGGIYYAETSAATPVGTQSLSMDSLYIGGGSIDMENVSDFYVTSVIMTSGNYIAPANTSHIYGTLNFTGTGVYTDKEGTMIFEGSNSGGVTLNSGDSITFTDLNINKTYNHYARDNFSTGSGTTVNVTETLTLTDGSIDGSGRFVAGPLSTVDWQSAFSGGDGLFVLETANDIVLPDNANLPQLELNNTNLTVTTSGNVYTGNATNGGKFTITAGTFENTANGTMDLHNAYDNNRLILNGGDFYASNRNNTGGATLVDHAFIDINGGTYHAQDTVQATMSTVTMNGGVVNAGSGVFNQWRLYLNDGTYNVEGATIGISNVFTFTGGSFNTGTGSTSFGSTVTISGGTYNIQEDGYVFSFSPILTNGGTINTGAYSVIHNALLSVGNGGIYIAGAGSTVTFNNELDISGGTFTSAIGANVVSAYENAVGVDFNSGTFIAPPASGTLQVKGGWDQESGATFTHNGGTLEFIGSIDSPFANASASTFNDVKISKDAKANTVTLGNTLNLDGDLEIFLGTLDTGTSDISLAGNWVLCPAPGIDSTACDATTAGDAEFVPGTQTVTLTGTDQTIYGSNDHTFYNFTKTVTVDDTLFFEAGQHQVMTGTTTLKGTPTATLSLRSTLDDSYWYFDPNGARDFEYLDTKDSYNHDHYSDGLVEISTIGLNITDSGNNVNWIFPGPPVVSNLGPFIRTNGSTTQDNTPTLTFDIDDPVDLTVDYQIQIDDSSDFSSPVVDYTSALASEGSMSFTVGQAEGTGTYTVGSSPQTLTDGSYYWRVRSTNSQSGTSDYSTANGGAIAFIVDSVGPIAVTQVSPNGNTGDYTPVYLWKRTTDDGGGYVITVKNSGDVEQYQITGINSGTSFTEAVASLSPGDYSWEIYAIDAAGNPGAVSSMDFTLINMVPEYSTYMYILILLFGMSLIYYKSEYSIKNKQN